MGHGIITTEDNENQLGVNKGQFILFICILCIAAIVMKLFSYLILM
jgi:hypothetical protein